MDTVEVYFFYKSFRDRMTFMKFGLDEKPTQKKCQVPQSVERRTLEAEVRGLKPVLAPAGGSGFHVISPIRTATTLLAEW